MTVVSEPRETARRRSALPGWAEPPLLALAGALFVTAMGLRGGDAGIPNSDDLVRLVEIRDLLAGQGWYDLMQYRLGLDGGTPMHWSRLVDAPVAAIVAIAGWIAGDQAAGEAVARIVWPAITAFLAMLALMTACARTGNAENRFSVAVIGAVMLWSIGVFSPGSLDHHNIQVALSLWLLALLLPGTRPVAAHAFAGLVAVLMLAIGMEVLPYVAAAGALVALSFVFGATGAAEARAFGLSVAVSAAVVFLATISPAHWGAAVCDAYSSFHLTVAAIGGIGLAAVTVFAHRTLPRLTGAAILGGAVLAATVAFFPQCLENPLSSLDPKLRTFWLEGVVETRSLADLLSSDPFAVVGLFGMAIAAFVVTVWSLVADRPLPRAVAVVFAAFLAMGIAVTAWQQRGFTFAAAFAVLPLGFWIASLRSGMGDKRSTADSLKLAGAWILSINLFWWIAGSQLAGLFSSAPTLQEQAAAASPRDYCYSADLYAPLAAEPKGVVLGATDIGASILLYTRHRTIAGPYHRDVGGILFLIDAMLADPDPAHAMLKQNGVTIVADCINAADGHDFIGAAPDGFQAALRGVSRPDWLEPVAATVGTPLVLYRVR